MDCDRVRRNARLVTLADGRPVSASVKRGAVAARDGRIVHAGSADNVQDLRAPEDTDCEGHWITSGLVDPHTHLIVARCPDLGADALRADRRRSPCSRKWKK